MMLVVPVWEVWKGERVSQLTVSQMLTTLHHPYHLLCHQYLLLEYLLLEIIQVKIQYLVLGSVARTVSFIYLVSVLMAYQVKLGGYVVINTPKGVWHT